MKKTYMKPTIEVYTVKTQGVLMTSGGVGTTSVGMSWDGTADTDEEGLSRGYTFFDDAFY